MDAICQEALHNFFRRLDFFDGNGARSFLELHQAANSVQPMILIVQIFRVFLVTFFIRESHRLLEFCDGCRVHHMAFTVDAKIIVTAEIELRIDTGNFPESKVVLHLCFLRDHVQADSPDARCNPGKIFVDEFFSQPDCFKNLSAR